MNIPEIRAFAPDPLPPFTPDWLRAGIEDRLALLTYLFCPEQEEPPEAVLARLRVEKGAAGTLRVRWRPRMRYPIQVYRCGAEFADQRGMVLSEGDGDERRWRLAEAVDGVGVFQGYERDSMGWPTAMAVAATVAASSRGFVVTTAGDWFVPVGCELHPLLLSGSNAEPTAADDGRPPRGMAAPEQER